MLSLLLTSATPSCLKIMGQQFDRMTLGLNLSDIFLLNTGYEFLSERAREDSGFFIVSYQVGREL